MTSLQWHHRCYVTANCHQTNVARFFHFGILPIKISDYASDRERILKYFIIFLNEAFLKIHECCIRTNYTILIISTFSN